MTYNDVRKNENKGFSLIELIVVVAIMAVLVAVLAPSLLAYVERSRAQKDDSAMSEVTNAVRLALADQDIYDEMLTVVSTGKTVAASYDKTDVEDEDEADLSATDLMRGVIITFAPENSVITIANGSATGNGTKKLSELSPYTVDGETKYDHLMQTRLENIVGKTIELTSQTYRNSDYSVFIKMGTLNQDAGITVNGEWNGTNLS